VGVQVPLGHTAARHIGAARQQPAGVKVKVSDRWTVAHDGKRYTEGDPLTVPEDVAAEWERSRWVERVTPEK
jgi:hypothetical protein